jgi:endothelin-converting enzyme/putative endopeptidase
MPFLFLLLTAASPAAEVSATIDDAAMDRSAQACGDFYQFACGGWIKATPIPDEEADWGRSFSEVEKRNRAVLRALLEDLVASPPADPEQRKLADYYATCMDEAKAETESPKTLQAALAQVTAVKDTAALAKVVGEQHLQGGDALFGFGSGQDFADATQVIGQAAQGGIGLPDRDYYLSDDAKMVSVRKAYLAHMERMFGLVGEKPPAAHKDAATVLRIETALAQVSLSQVDRRDPKKIYHRLERKGLEALAPHFAWKDYFRAIGTDAQPINVSSPAFFAGVDQLLAKTPLEPLQTYLRWHAIDSAAGAMGKKFVDESFAFTAVLTGQKVQHERWRRCVDSTDAMLPDALGKLFVAKTFGEDGKKRSRELIENIERAFADNLQTIAWMDSATKAQALAKLKKVANKIGYPDKWRDYSALTIDRTSHLANRWRAEAHEAKRELAKIGKPVDRDDFGDSPAVVNAGYDATLNQMFFPAGILQPPFFNRLARDPINYGAIGAVMGHELTHGYDDEGRQFDGDGNMREWWTKSVGDAYTERASCLAKQYSAYSPVPGVKLNGELTLGENIADLGGLRLAYRALLNATRAPTPAQAGDSDAQQFFLSFAQQWCESRRPELEAMLATVDPHSPSRFRVNGVVANMPEFAQAFHCQAPAAPRCSVW